MDAIPLTISNTELLFHGTLTSVYYHHYNDIERDSFETMNHERVDKIDSQKRPAGVSIFYDHYSKDGQKMQGIFLVFPTRREKNIFCGGIS